MTETQNPPLHLTFTPTRHSSTELPAPQPASKDLPVWYEMLSSNVEALEGNHKTESVKMCMPFGDALKSGWLLKSPVDITIEQTQIGDSSFNISTSEDTDQTVVSELEIPQPNRNGNSAFLFPNAIIKTGWTIQSPNGYSTLIVPPINRSEIRFTSLGMFAETDSETPELQLPIHVEQTPISIEKGEPLAQLIPMRRSTLLDDPLIGTYTEGDRLNEIKKHITRMNDVRTGFYRNELWTPKPGAKNFDSINVLRNHTNPNSGEEPQKSTVAHGKDERSQELLPEDHRHAFYLPEEYSEAVPTPKPSIEYIPEGYIETLEELNIGGTKQSTAKWVRDAMSLGCIIESDRGLKISRDPNGGIESFRAQNIGEDFFHQHMPEKAGSKHPLSPMEILNIYSHWIVVMEHGYSNFYSSPINHFQRHHRSFSGIVDADWYQGEVNIPGKFTERSDTATLNRGTPITQAIPLHRESIIKYAVVGDNAE